MGWFSRRRHRLGFGIHSPFAYKMVKDVLALPSRYRYYAEEALTAADSPSRQLTRLAIIVHRLTARYGYTLQTDGLSQSVRKLITLSAEGTYPTGQRCLPVLLVTSSPLSRDALLEASKSDTALLSLAPLEDFTPPSTGVLFHDTSVSLYFPYAKTAFVAYDIRF